MITAGHRERERSVLDSIGANFAWSIRLARRCLPLLGVLVGIFQAIQGVVALANDTFYVVGQEYVFQFDVTTWGWIHLIMGIVVAAAGFFVFNGGSRRTGQVGLAVRLLGARQVQPAS